MKAFFNLKNLKPPKDHEIKFYSDENDSINLLNFLYDSEDFTLYHSPEYIGFSRRVNGYADLIFIVNSGRPVLAFPIHRLGMSHYTTGYSGIIFGGNNSEDTLIKKINIFTEFLKLNKNFSLRVFQSPLSRGGINNSRQNIFRYVISSSVKMNNFSYSRLLDLNNIEFEKNYYSSKNLVFYTSKTRAEVRFSEKFDLCIDVQVGNKLNDNNLFYKNLYSFFSDCRQRTEFTTKPLDFLLDESNAIIKSGGIDLIVTISKEDCILSVVTCHIYNEFAHYFSNYSSSESLKYKSNVLALHVAILKSYELGVRYFELGRIDNKCPTQKSQAITKYKSKFGGDLFQIIYFEKKSLSLQIISFIKFIPRKLKAWLTKLA